MQDSFAKSWVHLPRRQSDDRGQLRGQTEGTAAPAGRRAGGRVPCLPGAHPTYTFHVAGRLRGQTIDTSSTCSETTFDCVTEVSEVQFPIKDPSTARLAERIGRALPRTERASADAARARNVAIVAIAFAELAFAAAIVLGVRRGRKVA